MTLLIPFPDISPVIFSIPIPVWTFSWDAQNYSLGGFDLAIHWYALAYVFGILFASWLIRQTIRRPALWPQNTPALTEKNLDDLMSWMVIGIIVGGRMGYVLFYKPQIYLADPIAALRIFDGGMSFHGGFLGVIFAGVAFCWKHQISIPRMADIIAISAPAGLLFGRLSNFINGELWGRETNLPWGVIFPGVDAQTCANAISGFCARHPSQLYEALGEGLILGSVLLYLVFRTQALRFTGLLTGIFVSCYGFTRFLVEIVRQPDAHFQSLENPIGFAIQFGKLGLTMGQILSLPMIFIGLWLVYRARLK
ncbi:MAG: prolipoprotein diacylglyceryl transferase [Planktomarina sp.]|jgi:phosphatidylglycerol:prolipoprotein diacylglycerol transferase|nr:prolipoprotein diacylglyceryl transferase [Planktomarina sp.]|tara:strand:- start:623 stop:1549 length:927 start_codon:yes stop_codon:yes gene_type:complete